LQLFLRKKTQSCLLKNSTGKLLFAAPPVTESLTPGTVNYATVTWDQLHRDARSLAGLLMPHAPFAGIVAITRGGLIPAAIVARELECRLVESVSVASYAEEAGTQGAPRLLKAPVAAGDGTDFLIVDDLVDSGVTARLVRALLPKARFACLYAKPAGSGVADHFVAEVPQDTWILFPWDTAPLFVPPIARRP
jgi:xanthine phosphoribosyltransferase